MQKTGFKHFYVEFGADSVSNRVRQMLDKRDQVDVESSHIKISYGNRKTGALVPSVSLIPVADCGNCKICATGCYDVRNVCFHKTVQWARANNSAIYQNASDKYWLEIEKAVKYLRFFRYHIGGDIKDFSYFLNMVGIAKRTPTCEFLAFTKMYDIVNEFIGYAGGLDAMPNNLHIIFSDWRGAEFDNPYNLPVSSPLWPDGTRGSHCTDSVHMCEGDCSACAMVHGGCWSAGPGDTILFEAH